jgi:hypothetical protein
MAGFAIKDIVDSGTGRSFENESYAPDKNYELLVMNYEFD